ncbi:MAG TPA: sigma-70 family RNA polymerase sigma factor [Methylomirabilota bacterium]|jgi:RNA polymerase sigma-70 factor (ECF subfamily)|nr:sigma-70 family RNA polymerase sigma factor [Methylomirabilota bacterium]
MEQPVAFQDLALSQLSSLYGYARLLSRNDADAEDLLQESLLKALRAFPSFKPHLSFKVWMFRIIKNAQIDRVRRLRARPLEAPNGAESQAGDPARDVLLYPVPLNPEEILLRRVAVEEVRDAIRRLPLVLREVVELREIEGLSYEQIAGVIGKPVGTVMSRLFRGRNLVRSAIQASARVQDPAPAVSAGLRKSYGL